MFNLGEWRLVREVKQELKSNLRTNGFSLIKDQIDLTNLTPAVAIGTSGLTDGYINGLIEKAELAGEFNDEVILDLSKKITGITGSEVGPVIQFFRRIIEWLKDPANREKVLMIVKALMMILLMFV